MQVSTQVHLHPNRHFKNLNQDSHGNISGFYLDASRLDWKLAGLNSGYKYILH